MVNIRVSSNANTKFVTSCWDSHFGRTFRKKCLWWVGIGTV